ncbi:MAG: CRISPR-associated endonuclease Cas1 [Nanoarchaeota archaeon]|nr:CRISPR-associated endonuclease Cas1 [Nanoarchaeota archaeon]
MDIHITTPGTRIKEWNGMLCIELPERTSIERVSYSSVNSIQINQNCGITSSVLASLLKYSIPTTIMDKNGHISGILGPIGNEDIDLIKAQIQHEQNIETAQSIVMAATNSKMNFLKYLAKNIGLNLNNEIHDICCLSDKIKLVESIDSLRGIEGMATKHYFKGLSAVLGNYGFNGRTRNPPRDMVNAALSYGYGFLARECHTALAVQGFIPSIGIYHMNYRQRQSLTFDVMELFRQGFVDRAVVALFNKNMLNKGCFISDGNSWLLNRDGRQTTICRLTRNIMPFRKTVNKEVSKLKKRILGGGNYEPYVWTFW